MNSEKGTPKTFDEAVGNAFEQILSIPLSDTNSENLERFQLIMKKHLRDYISQKCFHREEFIARNYRELFYKIFNVNPPEDK